MTASSVYAPPRWGMQKQKPPAFLCKNTLQSHLPLQRQTTSRQSEMCNIMNWIRSLLTGMQSSLSYHPPAKTSMNDSFWHTPSKKKKKFLLNQQKQRLLNIHLKPCQATIPQWPRTGWVSTKLVCTNNLLWGALPCRLGRHQKKKKKEKNQKHPTKTVPKGSKELLWECT